MQQIGLVKIGEGDLVQVIDPEGLKEVYSTTLALGNRQQETVGSEGVSEFDHVLTLMRTAITNRT